MTEESQAYAARLEIDYPERLDRFTTFFRLIWVIPVLVILLLLTGGGGETVITDTGEEVSTTGGGITSGLWLATMLMIVFREKYPRWWFDFARELTRFTVRVAAYLFLLTDQYPSTDDEQAVHLDIDYPNVEQDLNRFLPLVKWLLAIPHYVVLAVMGVVAGLAVVFSWFAIVFTGKYPRPLFNYVLGVARWGLRVEAYAFLLVTDRYPPFSLR